MLATKTIKLSANENCYGCSPLVFSAIENKYKEVYAYPEFNPIALKEKLALKFGVHTNNIVVGAGSVKIIDGLIQTFVKNDESVLTFEKSFIAYGQLSEMHGHMCNFAPLADYRCDPKNLLPFINNKTRLIFLANPNNPTGTIISHNELELLLNTIPDTILVALDEAYAEYVFDSSFPDAFALQKKHKNLIILRSFSKIYGLAGLRIGYAILNEHLAAQLSKTQIPYSINYLAADAAVAALNDEAFIGNSAKQNNEEALYLHNALSKLGFNTIKSHSNFIYLWFESDIEKKKVYDVLFSNGIIICDLIVFGQEKALRIGIGKREVNTQIIEILSDL